MFAGNPEVVHFVCVWNWILSSATATIFSPVTKYINFQGQYITPVLYINITLWYKDVKFTIWTSKPAASVRLGTGDIMKPSSMETNFCNDWKYWQLDAVFSANTSTCTWFAWNKKVAKFHTNWAIHKSSPGIMKTEEWLSWNHDAISWEGSVVIGIILEVSTKSYMYLIKSKTHK